MAVAIDAVGPSSAGAGSGGSNSLNWTHTAAGGPVALLVGVTLGTANDSGNDFTVTCDSVPMTLIDGPIHGNNSIYGFIKVYGLTGISSGAHAIAVTVSGTTPTGLAGGSVSFTGAASFGTAYDAVGNSATSSVAVPASTTGGIIFALVGTGHGNEAATSPATLQYLKDEALNTIGNCAAETTPSTGGAVTVGFTQDSNYWAIIAVEVVPSPPPPPPVPPPPLLMPPGLSSPAAWQFAPAPQMGAAPSTETVVIPPPPALPASPLMPPGLSSPAAWQFAPARPVTAQAAPPVVITTTGATFSPVVALKAGSAATVTWSCAGFTSQTGVSPSFSFGSAATRTVNMTVTGGGGYADVTLFNVGYDNTVDPGTYMPPSGYAKAAESVSGIANINSLTGLIYFLADFTPLAGVIDFTGMSALQFVECFGSDINGVTLTGCTSLIRLQIEACNQNRPLDLNPVAANLRDLRSAIQQGGRLEFVTLTSPMAALYHFCVRDQFLVNPPTLASFPVLQQFWTWNGGSAQPVNAYSYELSFSSDALLDVVSYQNQWSSADLTGIFPASRDSASLPFGTNNVRCDLHNNRLTSVILTGCEGLQNIDFSFNRLGTAMVDYVLTAAAGWGTSNGALDLRSNAPPTAAGTAAAATLTGRGWTVNVDSPATITYPWRLLDGVSGRPGVGSSGTQPPSASTAGGPLCASMSIKVTCAGSLLAGYYVWRADSAQAANCDVALWVVTGLNTGTLVPASHVPLAGMTAGQFNYAPLAAPIPLAEGATYAVVAGFPGNFPWTNSQLDGVKHPYGTGIANGPLFAFSSYLGVNPDPYNDDQSRYTTGNADPTATFPVTSFGYALFWVDVQVTQGPLPAPPPLVPPAPFTPMGLQWRTRPPGPIPFVARPGTVTVTTTPAATVIVSTTI